MCLTIGVIILSSTIKIQLVLFSKCTVGALMYSANASKLHQMFLDLLKYLTWILFIHKSSLRLQKVVSIPSSIHQAQQDYE